MEKVYSKKIYIITKVLYIISIIIGIYALLTVYNSYTYISSLVAENRLVIKDSLLSVISYYCNGSIPYVFYSISIFAMGYIINVITIRNEAEGYKEIKSQNFYKVKEDEEDLEKFIEEVKINKESLNSDRF